jgi:hypothetical protein
MREEEVLKRSSLMLFLSAGLDTVNRTSSPVSLLRVMEDPED